MNDTLQQFARESLIEGLAQLPESSQNLFKRMYGGAPNRRGDPTRTLEEIEALPISQVVHEMPPEKLDWAMQQVERTIQKFARRAEGGPHDPA